MTLREHLIADVENFWRFSSVRFGLFAAACASALGAYATARAMGADVVAHVPAWVLNVLIYGSMLGTFGSVIARGIDQPKLRKSSPTVTVPDPLPTEESSK